MCFQAVMFQDLSVTFTSYNTAGGCGDLIFSDRNRADGKAKCMKDIMTSSDISLFQEMHSDILEAELWDTKWSHSHLSYWSHGASRNLGGVCNCFKHSWIRYLCVHFNIVIIEGRCLATFMCAPYLILSL